MAIKNLLCRLGMLVLCCSITGCASSTSAAQKWPTGPLAFPVDEWKTIDKTGTYVVVPPKEIPKWEGWTESTDEYHRKTRVKLQKDGSKLTYTFGIEYGPRCDDRLYIKRETESGALHHTDGFVDASGKVVIAPVYFHVEPFSGNYAFVKKEKDASWQVIDKSGALNCTIPADLDVDMMPVAEENCLVKAKKKGANKFGLDTVSGFYNFEKNEFYPIGQEVYIGRASEELWEYSPKHPFLWGFVDSHAHVVIPAQFAFSSGFHEGLACVLKDHRWGYIDRTGKMVIELPADCSYAEAFTDGRAAVAVGGESRVPGFLEVKKGAKWGFIDKTGKFVIPPTFYVDDSSRQPGNRTKFSEGLAHVAIGDALSHSYGFIDKNGAWKIKPKFKDAQDFENGSARVCLGHIGFNKNDWDAKGYKRRLGLFSLFIKQFDLIGMPRNLLIGAWGEPDKRDWDGDVYALNTSTCGNAYLAVKIHYDWDHVGKFKFVGWERETPWMTELDPHADILNWRFKPEN
jgi:hypothetical protein